MKSKNVKIDDVKNGEDAPDEFYCLWQRLSLVPLVKLSDMQLIILNRGIKNKSLPVQALYSLASDTVLFEVYAMQHRVVGDTTYSSPVWLDIHAATFAHARRVAIKRNRERGFTIEILNVVRIQRTGKRVSEGTNV